MMLSQPIATNESEWPKTWILTDEVKDVNPESVQATLNLAGITYWRIGNEAFHPPSIPSVRWDYQASRPLRSQIVDEPKYGCANVISLNPDDHFVDHTTDNLQASFGKKLHDGTRKICYVLVGSGIFDIECDGGKRLQVHVKKADVITFPEDIYHRFTANEEDIQCNGDDRYFAGQPVTGPLVRIIVESKGDILRSSRPLSPRTTVC